MGLVREPTVSNVASVTDSIRLIGYWRNEENPEYPDPHQLADPDWPEDDEERHLISGYLAAGTYTRHFMGLSPCRICGQRNGASEFTDGTYAWPEGLGHYVEIHGVRLPGEFVQHAKSRSDALEVADFNLDWWLANTH